MSAVVWHLGVPWLEEALVAAQLLECDGPVTEVARGFIEQCKGDPTRVPRPGDPTAVQRGDWVAVVSADLVVIGHGKHEKASPTASEPADGRKPRRGGRGPKSYRELEQWLGDEGYAVIPTKSQHRAVVGPDDGRTLVTLAYTPSDPRTLANDVAECRRTLGVELRRHG